MRNCSIKSFIDYSIADIFIPIEDKLFIKELIVLFEPGLMSKKLPVQWINLGDSLFKE